LPDSRYRSTGYSSQENVSRPSLKGDSGGHHARASLLKTLLLAPKVRVPSNVRRNPGIEGHFIARAYRHEPEGIGPHPGATKGFGEPPSASVTWQAGVLAKIIEPFSV
jgi:hypothetical protein